MYFSHHTDDVSSRAQVIDNSGNIGVTIITEGDVGYVGRIMPTQICDDLT